MIIKCKNPQCGQEFEFTEKEEEWYRNKFGDDFSPPKYCKPCREARKAEKQQNGDRGKGRRK